MQLAFRNRLTSHKLDDRQLAPREFMPEVRSDHAGATAQDYGCGISGWLHLQSMDAAPPLRLPSCLLEGLYFSSMRTGFDWAKLPKLNLGRG
jgi:hypothetical protein